MSSRSLIVYAWKADRSRGWENTNNIRNMHGKKRSQDQRWKFLHTFLLFFLSLSPSLWILDDQNLPENTNKELQLIPQIEVSRIRSLLSKMSNMFL